MVIAQITTDNREAFREYHKNKPWFGTAPEALLQGFAAMSELEVHVISCTQNPVTAPEKLADNIWFHSVQVPKLGWMRTLYAGCVWAVRMKLRKIRPDIVHGQGTERECAMAAAFSGYPNVLTIHGNMAGMAEFFRSQIGSFHWLAARLETLALGKAAGVLCNSAYTETRVSPRAKRVWRVPNAVRAPFLVRPPERDQPGRPVLLNVGVLASHKRQVEILAMARRLWQRGLRFEMQFAGATPGDSEYGARFMRELEEGERDGYARHLGSLGVTELIGALDAASALVHFPAEEAFGLVVAEALSRNLKLFAAAIGGIPDITAGVEGAELFAMEDWPALEEAVARWIEAGCPCPGHAAAFMRERYDPVVVAREHVRIYREVLKTRS